MSGALFTFHEDRARAALAQLETEATDYYGIEPVSMQSDADELHSLIDRACWSASDTGMGDNGKAAESAIITATRDGASLAFYPLSLQEPEATLGVNPGDGGPILLGGSAPTPDDKLDDDDYTVELLRETVGDANNLVLEHEHRGAKLATLDHTYAGSAVRIIGGEPGDVSGISGAFRVLCWLSTTSAVVGNGESPESIWVTLSAPERVA